MLKRLFCCAALLGLVACVDPTSSGATGDTTLYAYDNAGKQVMFWGNFPAAFDAGDFTTPTTILTSSFFDNVTPLAWGGMVMDPSRNRLYLVGESGNIVRLDSIRSLSSSVSTADVVAFKLDSAARLDGGKFGQVALDSAQDVLYVSENGTSSTQIWVVTGASTRGSNATVTLQTLQQANDTGGYGVAANANVVYGSFGGGDSVGVNPAYTGYRLRRGNSSSFDANGVLIGDQTGLGLFSTLALDYSNRILYVGLSASDFGAATNPVLAFDAGQFGGAYNQAAAHALGDTTSVANLRVLAHPGTKDWLVGLSASGNEKLWIWKSPSTPASATFKGLLAPAGAQFRGIALDGQP